MTGLVCSHSPRDAAVIFKIFVSALIADSISPHQADTCRARTWAHFVLVGVVGAILVSQVRCRKTSDSYLDWSKTLSLLAPCPLSVLRKPVRLCRRLYPVRGSLRGPFGTNVLYRDSTDLSL